MKNEINRNELVNCVECDKCKPELLKDQGLSCTLLSNGQWSRVSVCDLYKIICTIDATTKGYVFTPYETLHPDICPLSPKGNL